MSSTRVNPNLSAHAKLNHPCPEYNQPVHDRIQSLQNELLSLTNRLGEYTTLYPRSIADRNWAASVASLAHLRMASHFLAKVQWNPDSPGRIWTENDPVDSTILVEPKGWETRPLNTYTTLGPRAQPPSYTYLETLNLSGEVERMGLNMTTVWRIFQRWALRN